MNKRVIAMFTEGFPDLTSGKVYDVISETNNTITILDDAKDKYKYPKALFMFLY